MTVQITILENTVKLEFWNLGNKVKTITVDKAAYEKTDNEVIINSGLENEMKFNLSKVKFL